jgi:hypothetical protein
VTAKKLESVTLIRLARLLAVIAERANRDA